MDAQPPTLAQLLRAAAPDCVVDVAADYILNHHPGWHVDVLLADYRISGLWPVLGKTHDSAGWLGDRNAAARAYASQQTIVERRPDGSAVRALIPLSVWSDRVGVMVADFDPGAGSDTLNTDALNTDALNTDALNTDALNTGALNTGALNTDALQTDALNALLGVAEDLTVALLAADRSTDRYRRARRRQRLTMAAEMQWDLLPGRSLGGPTFHLAGQLEPAYAVCGDHFDWSLNDQRLTITALNGDGNGISATLLTIVAVNAMRNARRSGASLVEQAELASDTVYSLHGGRHHVATLLLEIDLRTGMISLIDAGSPQLLLLRGTHVTPIAVDHQLPLGMFADSRYGVQHLTLERDDRLFIVSDGVHAARPGDAPPFGERAMATAARSTRLAPATEAVGGMMRGLHDYHDGHDLADDAVIVCLDWLGPLELGPLELGPLELGPLELGPLDPGPLELSTKQSGPASPNTAPPSTTPPSTALSNTELSNTEPSNTAPSITEPPDAGYR